MKYDVLIIGGGAAGLSSTLVLPSAKNKTFAQDKSIGIILHQRSSHLQTALFNNVLGLAPGTTGQSILEGGKEQLSNIYPHVVQIEGEKVNEINKEHDGFSVLKTNQRPAPNLSFWQLDIPTYIYKGLEAYIARYPRAVASKERICLKTRII